MLPAVALGGGRGKSWIAAGWLGPSADVPEAGEQESGDDDEHDPDHAKTFLFE